MKDPYFTTYPNSAWYWFDEAVYAEHSPKGVGDLPTAVFKKLKQALGASARYTSKAAAIADLEQALA